MAHAFCQAACRRKARSAATAKRFPGLGLARAEKHRDKGRIVIRAAARKLHEGLLPFRKARGPGRRAAVMVSPRSGLCPTGSKRPAAFSSTIINGLLRSSSASKA